MQAALEPELPSEAILALDPGWSTGSWGVAVLVHSSGRWRVRALAPSACDFLALSHGQPIDWSGGLEDAGRVDVENVLRAARKIAGGLSPTICVLDIPLAVAPIRGRRLADNVVGQEFGSRGCSTHSPTSTRPGALSETLRVAFEANGFTLATSTTTAGEPLRLVETYPHPALLALMNSPYRVPYKVTKIGRYWPELASSARRTRLISVWANILTALSPYVADLQALSLPTCASPIRTLKRFEDALDALIVGWIGIRYLEGTLAARGDESAAIWLP